MIPINFAPATNTLYLAFGERVDHAALYAIERTLDCRTQPCVASRTSIARQLESMRQLSRPGDVEFLTRDLKEIAGIMSSYVARLSPEDVRVSRLGGFIWLRLKSSSAATNLVFRLQSESCPSRRAIRAERPSSSSMTAVDHSQQGRYESAVRDGRM